MTKQERTHLTIPTEGTFSTLSAEEINDEEK
jgi:hypothetical protein